MDRLRFSGAPWFVEEGQEVKVFVGGAGGIGSWLSLFLNRAGFRVETWDYDSIESHNIGGQFYNNGQLRYAKVNALRDNIAQYGDPDNFLGVLESVEHMGRDYIDDTVENVYFFSAFDNMEARRTFFNHWYEICAMKERNGDSFRAIYIDGRLEMEQLQIFCVPYEEKAIQEYADIHLFADSVVPDLACSLRQTSHTAAMIATFMTSFFTNYLSNLKFGIYIKEVPFFFEYVVASSLVNQKTAQLWPSQTT